MNLDKLFKMQRLLDERIIREKGLANFDIFPNTVLALDTELSETANEARFFKHWSNDQEPRFERECHACKGLGEFHRQLFRGQEYVDDEKEICLYCNGTGIEAKPLLEEYVDGLHFFLSVANQKGWNDAMYLHEEAIDDVRETGFDGGLTGAFLEMKYWLLKAYIEKDRDEKIEKHFGKTKQEYCFRCAWFIFVAIGLIGFGFTEEQIEQAYMDKNAVNHERQANGY